MFNSLASFILGNGNRNATDIEDHNQRGASDKAIDNNFKFVSTNCKETDDEEDSEWLLVEKGDGDCTPQQTDSEEEIPFIEIKNSPTIRTRHSRNNSNVGSQDGAFSLLPSSPVPNSMDESWFVTPPPCFTSTGSVEMSPLENLLIEHPSMSVYHSIRSSLQQQSEETDQDGLVVVDLNDNHDYTPYLESDTRDEGPSHELDFVIHPAFDRINTGHTMRVARNRNDAVIDALAQPQVKQAVSKHSRRGTDKNARQLCRNAMERNNKVREVNNKGGRQKRNDMTHCKVISRANNNRKC